MEVRGGRAARASTICGGRYAVRMCAASLSLILLVALHSQAQLAETPEPLLVSEPDRFVQLHTLAAGTEIHLRLLEPVGSHTHKRGDRFKLEVAQLITVNGAVIVPAGSPAIGEVVHAAKPGMSGKAGELIWVVRSLSAGEYMIKLRSFTAGNGENRLALAQTLGVTLGIPALFVVGKNLVLPAGTNVYAKVAEDALLPSILAMKAADLPQPAVLESQIESNNNESNQQ